jgi:hypothetical protein
VALLATALCLLLAAPACGTPGKGPPTVSQFAITYQRSGGLKPISRFLQITPGRHATTEPRLVPVVDDNPLTARFRVGVRTVKRLRGALERAEFVSIHSPAPGSGNCADCFYYSIAYRGHRVSFDDFDLPRRLRPVVDQLEAIIATHRPLH